MSEKVTGKFDEGRDPVVTAVSLIFIVIQSLIIIFGYLNRWDWLAWECAAILIGSSIWVVGYGIKAIVQTDQLMRQEMKEQQAGEKNG